MTQSANSAKAKNIAVVIRVVGMLKIFVYLPIGIGWMSLDKKWWGPVPTSLIIPAALVIIARFCALAVLRDHTGCFNLICV